jgi:hypothetical protein
MTNEIQAGSVWQGRHGDNHLKYLKILAVEGARVCVLHQGGRRCWQSADTLRTRYQPAGEVGQGVRFPAVEPLPPEDGAGEPGALAQGEALAAGLGATIERVVAAQVPPLTEAPPRPQRPMAPAQDEGAYARPGMVIPGTDATDRLYRVEAEVNERLKGTGIRVTAADLLEAALSEEWAATVLARVAPR